MDWYLDVKKFHKKFGLVVNSYPTLPDTKTIDLRVELIFEEFKEVVKAIIEHKHAGVADGIADLIYVLLGTAVSFGIDMRPVWDLVQEANMKKVGGGTREDGKILKPEGWQAPDIEKEMIRQNDSLVVIDEFANWPREEIK